MDLIFSPSGVLHPIPNKDKMKTEIHKHKTFTEKMNQYKAEKAAMATQAAQGHTPGPATRVEAEAQGFTVDSHCYPWVAYNGPRFAPDKWHPIFTDKEANLLAACKLTLANLAPKYCNDHLVMQSLRDAIAKAEGRD